MSVSGVFVAMGANLGDRAATLAAARREIASIDGIRLVASSSDFETEPVGGPPDQPKYLNAVIELVCELEPEALLAELQRLEDRHGRERTMPDGPRTLDLDILLFGPRIIRTPALTVPHPRMWGREFVMAPLRELCGPERLAALRARFE